MGERDSESELEGGRKTFSLLFQPLSFTCFSDFDLEYRLELNGLSWKFMYISGKSEAVYSHRTDAFIFHSNLHL